MLLAGCATYDRDKLTDEVATKAYVTNGRPVQESLDRLTIRGFECQEGTVFNPERKGSYECIRHMSNFWPGYECTHRLQFEVSEADTVANLQVNQPACTEKTKW